MGMGFVLGLVSSATFGLIPLFSLPLLHAGFSAATTLFYRFAIAALSLGIILALRHERFALRGIDVCKLAGLSSMYMLAALLLSVVGFVDYGAAGVLTVVAFGLLRGQKWEKAGQLLAMGYIHGIMIKGMMIPVGGFDVKVQSFAVLALIPIWLYDGRQGMTGKGWKWFSYAFYPLHMLIIGLVARMI